MLWTVYRGVGHAVDMVKNGWVHTLCNTYGPGHVIPDRPKRICRKCRLALQEIAR